MTTTTTSVRPAVLPRIRVLLRGLVLATLVDPVRTDGPAPRHWSPALRLAVLCALPAVAVAVVLVVLAQTLRGSSRLVEASESMWLPDVAIAPLLGLLLLSVALVATASRLLAWPLWLAVLAVLGIVLFHPLTLEDGWRLGVWGTSWVLVVVLGLTRLRRPLAWWELWVTLVLLTVGNSLPLWLLAQQFAGFGEIRTLVLESQLSRLSLLSVPAVMVGGYGLASLTTRFGLSLTAAVRRRPPVLTGVLVAVGVWLLVQSTWLLASGDQPWQPESLVFSAAVLLLAGAVGALLLRLLAGPAATVRGRGAAEVSSRTAPEVLEPLVWPVALGFGSAVVLGSVLLLPVDALLGLLDRPGLSGWVLSTEGLRVQRAVVWLLVLVWSVRAVRRGSTLLVWPAAVLTATTLSSLNGALGYPLPGTWWPEPMALAGAVLAVLVWAVRPGRSDPGRRQALLAALLVAALWPWRELLAEPLVLLSGVSAVGVVLVGLLWSLLSDAGWTRRGSGWFPQEARVLLWFGYSVLSLTVLAWISLTLGQGSSIDLSALARQGDDVLGTMLLGTVQLAALARLLRRRGDVPDRTATPSPSGPAR